MNYPTSETNYYLHQKIINECGMMSAVLFSILVMKQKEVNTEEFIVKKSYIEEQTQLSIYKQTQLVEKLRKAGFLTFKRTIRNQIKFTLNLEKLKLNDTITGTTKNI